MTDVMDEVVFAQVINKSQTSEYSKKGRNEYNKIIDRTNGLGNRGLIPGRFLRETQK